jgi:starch synthase (maltosyl-transferring)
VLAATLGANYGIYGPAFELCASSPREPGSEEYLDSEKYEIKQWDLEQPQSIRGLVARVNRIRRDNPALQSDRGLVFHPIGNENLICYSKQTGDLRSTILVAVSLDSQNAQSGFVELSIDRLGLGAEQEYEVHDLLTDHRYRWRGARNYVALHPKMPSHIFRICR